MSEETGFLSVESSRELSQLSGAVFTATSDLMAYMNESLPKGRQAMLAALLSGGGSVGFEVMVDRNGSRTLRLIGSVAGERAVVAEVMLVGQPPRVRSV